MTPKPLCKFWIASCTPDGGLYRYQLYDDSAVRKLKKIELPLPMWIVQKEACIVALLRKPFPDRDDSALISYNMKNETVSETMFSTKGAVACHFCLADDDLYVANYLSGSIIKMPDRLVMHHGKGPDPNRQEGPHVHSAFLSPDKRYILSCDLGLDTVFVYDRDLNLVSSVTVPPGSGPRHLIFSNDGRFVYVVNEMGTSVSVFEWKNGILSHRKEVPVLSGESGKCGAIQINRSGDRMYVTERRTNTVVVFAVCGEELVRLQICECVGEEPRDFTLLANDRFAVVSNQFSDSVTLFHVDRDGLLRQTGNFFVPSPLCCIEEQTCF